MRVAVLSDIHANLTALDAVVADIRMHAPDAVVVGGDLVGSGSRPAEVIDRIREIDWPVIQGNSDEMRWNAARLHAFLARPVMHPFVGIIERAPGQPRWQRSVTTGSPGYARRHFNGGKTCRCRARVAERCVAIAGYGRDRLRTRGHLGEPECPRGDLRTHPHQLRPSDDVMDVANCGSVSLSYDGDPRAAYALVDGSQIAIRRVQYDIDEEIRELHARRCPDAGWTAATLLAAVPQPLTAR